MIDKANASLRIAISLSLVVCLLQGSTAYKYIARQYIPTPPEAFQFIPALMENDTGTAISIRQKNLKSSHNFVKDVLIFDRTSIDLIRVLFFFLDKSSEQYSKFLGRNAIAIRAPPYFKF